MEQSRGIYISTIVPDMELSDQDYEEPSDSYIYS